MSNEAITWSYAQRTGKGAGCKAVLVALADRADEEHSCYPGQRDLAERTEQSERAVRGHLKHLEDQGFIVRTPRWDKNGHRTSDRYVLPVSVHVDRSTGKDDRRQNQPPAASAAGPDRTHLPADNVDSYRQDLPGNPKREPTVGNPQVNPSAEEPDAKTANRTRKEPAPPPGGYDKAFDQWYGVYPRHEGKAAAKAKFVQALKKGIPLDVLTAGARRYREDPNREEAFTKHPATWLNQGCWEDDPLPPRGERPDEPMYDPAKGRTMW